MVAALILGGRIHMFGVLQRGSSGPSGHPISDKRYPPAVFVTTVAVTHHHQLSSCVATFVRHVKRRRHCRHHMMTRLLVEVHVVVFALGSVPRQRGRCSNQAGRVLFAVERANAGGAGCVGVALLVVRVGAVRVQPRQEIFRIEEIDPSSTLTNIRQYLRYLRQYCIVYSVYVSYRNYTT